ncbi:MULTISPECIES: sensor histidine kinase [unclassified Acidovorax]|uniref:sensor histidine kinase n=1 Tax=unclassified Acidovorax TaxID=2684926 RepID=UPI000B008CE8|nr:MULTISPECIES: ATP-binding protein [unclassified Acidovorax]
MFITSRSPLRRMPSFSIRQLSTVALLSGVLLTLGVGLATTWVASTDRNQLIQADREKAELLARMLEDQTTRTMDSAFFVLATLAESRVFEDIIESPSRGDEALKHALLGVPFMRGLLVINGEGRILASNSSDELGIQIDMRRLGPLPADDKNAIGPLIAGRGISSLASVTGKIAAPKGLGFIPLLRKLKTLNQQSVYAVGLLNPDALANIQQLAVEKAGYSSAVATYKGEFLAGAGTITLPTSGMQSLPIFQEHLPAREHASFIGRGLGGEQQIVAFRVSRTHPVVIVVEEPRALALSRWLDDSVGYLWLGGGACALMLLLSLVAWRGLRLRESAQLLAEDAQNRIAQSERELAVLMQSVQEVIFRTDESGHITFVNAQWIALGSHGQTSPVGRPLHELVEPRSQQSVAQLFQNGASGKARHCQASVRLDDGRRKLFDMALVPLLHEGQVVGFAGSAVDVTERWIAQQKLRSELEFRGLLLEMNPLPISMTDMDGRLLLVNRAWEEYKGRRRKDVIGLRLQDFLPSEEAVVHEAADQQLKRERGTVRFETRVLNGNQSWRDTRVTKAIVADSEGVSTGILCTLMDVSDFREAERVTREARDSAEEASRSKSEFVANMSHELRTPLQSIMGFSELGMYRAKAHPAFAAMFEDVHRAGERMLSLVNDLLDVAKLESTVGTFHLEKVDLRGVIRPVLRELQPLLAQRRLLLDLNLGDAPLTAKVDPVRFEQVIRNVVANAIKFSPEESQIQIHARVDSQGQIRIAVGDSGPGIPPFELTTIFEAFKQSSTTKDGSGGTGLGLAICKKILEALGGQIYAENRQPHGAVFHITLPARTSDTMPAELN